MLSRVKQATNDAIKQWKDCDSACITNKMREIFIRRARGRLVSEYREMLRLNPGRSGKELARPRLKQLRSEDLKGVMWEYRQFLIAAKTVSVPKPINDEVVETVLRARSEELMRSKTGNV